MARHVIGPESELRAEGQRIVKLEGRSIGIFYRNKAWFALRNVCPHHGAELCRGLVSGTTRISEDGRLVYEMDDQVIRCPWHGFEFDLATGRSLVDPDRLRVRTYPITVEDGLVVIST